MPIRPIVDTLRELRAGGFLDEASESLANVVKQVSRTGKAGALTLRLNVKPAGRGSVRTVMVEGLVKEKLPELDQEVTVFFPTAEGNLSREDPSQMKLWPPQQQVTPENVDTKTEEILASA